MPEENFYHGDAGQQRALDYQWLECLSDLDDNAPVAEEESFRTFKRSVEGEERADQKGEDFRRKKIEERNGVKEARARKSRDSSKKRVRTFLDREIVKRGVKDETCIDDIDDEEVQRDVMQKLASLSIDQLDNTHSDEQLLAQTLKFEQNQMPSFLESNPSPSKFMESMYYVETKEDQTGEDESITQVVMTEEDANTMME